MFGCSKFKCLSGQNIIHGPLKFVDCYQRFHHIHTAFILLVLCVVITLREWSIDSIDCSLQQQQPESSTINPDIFSTYYYNNYCKLHGQFISFGCNKSSSSSSFTELGYTWLNRSSNEEENHQSRSIDNYELPSYQWFSFLLFIFAILLQLPYQIWKCFAYNSFMLTLKRTTTIEEEDGVEQNMDSRIQMVMSHSTNGCCTLLIIVVWLVKLMNIALLSSLVLVLHLLTKGTFIMLPIIIIGHQWISTECHHYGFYPFPKSTLCMYWYYDQKHSSKQMILIDCLMPINSLLEHVMLFLWIWLAIMAIISIWHIIHQFILAIFPCWRRYVLIQQTNHQWNERTYRLGSKSYTNYIVITSIWIQNTAQSIIPSSLKPSVFPLLPIQSNRRSMIVDESSTNV